MAILIIQGNSDAVSNLVDELQYRNYLDGEFDYEIEESPNLHARWDEFLCDLEYLLSYFE